MADEFQLGSGNWWDSTSRNRFDSTGSTPASSTSLNSMGGSFGTWPTEIVDMKAARSCMDSSSVSVSGSSMIFPADNSQKLQAHESSSAGGLLSDPNLQMMGLGLSSQTMDWNQAFL